MWDFILLLLFLFFGKTTCSDFTNQTNKLTFSGWWNFQHDQGSKLSSERSGTPKKRKAPPPPISPMQVKKRPILRYF